MDAATGRTRPANQGLVSVTAATEAATASPTDGR